ncbi:Iron-sulfur protein NUBPL [Tetrabaena socialis]|uniref:Iron-sulfur protein NUBPL n=1 Tax=Tetrabaena socialis TaxID=47790 RepID=A0A2J8A8B2_9CHLO|nr:Iron-sulfur protein NUBPL [Tetrabaena socialis]|eukprot:PNH08772.1 Iron-sulfur protein NUBPL [Tetrabaena socialis]
MATRLGLRVGLLDADIHGPSVPMLMNLKGKPEVDKQSTCRLPSVWRAVPGPAGAQALMLPKENYRVKTMSFGFFLEGDEPVVWRGPMVNNAFDKMLFGTEWGKLDVLVVDMPPGTGDAQINLGQRIPLSGAVLVSTPQDIALIDVRRGAQMFLKLRVPLLGLVENMSYHRCSQCGHVEHIFGSGGVERAAKDYSIEVVGQVPLHVDIQTKSDAGTPVVASEPRGELAAAYGHIAERIMAQLAQLGAGAQQQGPRITVE